MRIKVDVNGKPYVDGALVVGVGRFEGAIGIYNEKEQLIICLRPIVTFYPTNQFKIIGVCVLGV